MYNTEQKERFLQKHPEAKLWFEKTEPFEKDNGKDLYDFNVPEILEFYKMLFTASLDRLLVANGLFTKYSDFALKNTLIADGQNHFIEINTDLLAKCLDRSRAVLTTRDELRIIISKLVNPLDKYVFQAMFDGLKGDDYCEITQLKRADIDETTRTAKLCTGRVVKLSPELIEYAKESYETDVYYSYIDEDKIAVKNTNVKKMTGDIFKSQIRKNSSDDIHIQGQHCYRIVVRCTKWLEIPARYLSGKHLWDSGVMDLAKKISECKKIPIKDCFYGENLEEIAAQYNFTVQMRSNYLKKYRDYIVE